MKKLDKKAFSMVELVVVIAIISIVVVGSIVGVSALLGWKATKLQEEVISSVREVKTLSMGKDAVELKIGVDGDGNYYFQKAFSEYTFAKDADDKLVRSTSPEEYEKKEGLGNISKLEVTVKFTDAGHVDFELNKNNSVTVRFNRSSGSLEFVKVNDIQQDGCYIKSMVIKQKNSSKQKVVVFEQLTGQVFGE